MALKDDILALIQEQPGISDAELAQLVPGPKSRHQQVNARCRALVREGCITREKPPSGPIRNFSCAQYDVPEGRSRPRVGVKPPPRGAAGGCPAVPPGSPACAVMPISLTVEFHWQSAGEVSLSQDHKLTFPNLPKKSGIYRIRFPVSRSVYIGETVDLRRRMQNYRTPGVSQTTSTWINRFLCERLADGSSVLLEACIDAVISVGGTHQTADMASKSVRVMIEQAAILAERQTEWKTLNKAS